MAPHSGLGGCTPRPMKLSWEAARIDWATPIVIWTIRGAMAFGRMCLRMMRVVEQLMAVAASRYSILRMFSTEARAMRT